MSDQTLSHSERLRSLGAIRRMFEQGQGGFVYPFRYVWYAENDQTPSVEVLFTVPKKYHKRANKRNLLRRRTKEAYRLHKQALGTANSTLNLDIALIYSSKEMLPYKTIENAVQKILGQVMGRM